MSQSLTAWIRRSGFMDIAFSSCPNDTFIFHAMLNGFVDTRGLALTPHIHDVEELNRRAFSGRHDVTKMSFCAYLHLKESYSLLESGSALGFGCGPLLVARRRDVDLSGARVAIPGIHTTAYLLMLLWNSGITDITPMRFDEIMPAVAEGRFDAGLIIHEGRFVYPDHGLECVIDLGSWWEEETGAAIPLGCIAVKKIGRR
jgi:1,4-dihydroxy-6-naphthoate synthase